MSACVPVRSDWLTLASAVRTVHELLRRLIIENRTCGAHDAATSLSERRAAELGFSSRRDIALVLPFSSRFEQTSHRSAFKLNLGRVHRQWRAPAGPWPPQLFMSKCPLPPPAAMRTEAEASQVRDLCRNRDGRHAGSAAGRNGREARGAWRRRQREHRFLSSAPRWVPKGVSGQ